MKFNHEKAQEMMNFLLEKDIKYFTKLRKTFELKLSKDLNTSEVAKVLEPMREEDKMMTADEVALKIIHAYQQKKKTLIMTFQGKLTVFLNKWMNGLMDTLVYNSLKKERNSPLK